MTLTWLWLTAYVFLLGAELNAELERQVEGNASNVDPALNDQLVPTAVQSPEIPQFEPVAGKRHAPVSTLIDFAGNGAIATVGFAMLRRGRPVGILAIAFAAMVAWRKRPPEMGNADA